MTNHVTVTEIPGVNPQGTKLSLGRTLITGHAQYSVPIHRVMECLYRHQRGDWGTVCPEDAAQNNEALQHGDRVLSAYPIHERPKRRALRDVRGVLRVLDYHRSRSALDDRVATGGLLMTTAEVNALREQFREGDEVVVTFPPVGGRVTTSVGTVLEIGRASLAVVIKHRTHRVKLHSVQLVRRVQDIPQPAAQQPKDEPMNARLISEDRPAAPLTQKPFEALRALSSPPPAPPEPAPPPLPPVAEAIVAQAAAPVPVAPTKPDDITAWLEMGISLRQMTRDRIAALRAEAVAKNAEADALTVALASLEQVANAAVTPPARVESVAFDGLPPGLKEAWAGGPEKATPHQRKAIKKVLTAELAPKKRRRKSFDNLPGGLAEFCRQRPTMPVDQLCELAKRSGFEWATVLQIRKYRWRELNEERQAKKAKAKR